LLYFAFLGTHLFVKVPRPGDSEVTFSVFESRTSSQQKKAVLTPPPVATPLLERIFFYESHVRCP